MTSQGASAATPFTIFKLARDRECWRPCVHHAPSGGQVKGAVLHVPALGEEMNKSRRMVAWASRELASSGFAVLRPDLLGCGDAPGEFEIATWQDWTADLLAAADWLQRAYPQAPLWLWSHRAGSLLLPELQERLATPSHLLLWQPVLQGRSVLQHWLRLKATATWASGQGKQVAEQARTDLSQGRAIEVAGYKLTANLAGSLERAQFSPPARDGTRAVWLEVSNAAQATLSPASQAHVARWSAQGQLVQAHVVTGPPFWHTLEIEDAPDLVARTLECLNAEFLAEAQE